MQQTMRIGIDAREAYRPEPRGIGLYIRHLMREFAGLAPADDFLLYHQRTLAPGRIEIPANMRPRHTSLPGERFHSWERLQMPWRIRRDRLDVYHGTYNTLPPRRAPWLADRRAPPMVVTLHDVIVTWWPDDEHDPFVQYARKVTPRVVREADLILTVSEFSKNDICTRFGADPAKVRIFHNGVHPDFLAGAPADRGAAARQKHADGRPYLYSTGAHLERKNTGRLIEAFGRWKQQRRDLPHLLLVSGLGQQTGTFRARAEAAGAAEHVRFLPYLDRREMIELFAGAELFVYPSMVEGWGIPVLEALVLGTPVLTSNTSAMPEAGGEHAHYFDPASVESMAAEIDRALAEYVPRFAAVREAAVARARTFTWRRAAGVHLEAYRQVAR